VFVTEREGVAATLVWRVKVGERVCQDGVMNGEDLRLAVYRMFAETGRAADTSTLARQFGVDPVVVARGLEELAAARHLVLSGEGGIVMAHPFSAVPLGFSVMGARVLWWGGCAWDSFALPHLLPAEGEMLVATRCPACGRAHAWNVGTARPPKGGQVAHFLVPAARMWDDVVIPAATSGCSAPRSASAPGLRPPGKSAGM
jgi:Alkylmercury lyase